MSTDLIKAQIDKDVTVQKFTTIFSAVHKVDQDKAKIMFEVEKFHFLRSMNESTSIPADISHTSAAGVFLEVVSNGLSFASNAKHVYLLSRSVKTGKKTDQGKDIYENRLYYQTQPDGKIYQAQRAGSIAYVTKPVIVYEGDAFAIATNERGEQIIRHEVKLPRPQNAKIIAGYVYVVFPNGNREPFWMDLNDIDRLKGYSSRQNSKWDSAQGKRVPGNPNALYSANNGQIDSGFFGAKLINGALKNVRKSSIASQYEVDEETSTQLPEAPETGTYQPTMVVEAAGTLSEQTNHTSSPAAATVQGTNEPF